jgi:predicted TIM-barrel fold metal-dependent hydrolase
MRVKIIAIEEHIHTEDYVYESSKTATQFMDSVAIDEGDRARICHLNAERLLGL